MRTIIITVLMLLQLFLVGCSKSIEFTELGLASGWRTGKGHNRGPEEDRGNRFCQKWENGYHSSKTGDPRFRCVAFSGEASASDGHLL